MPKLTAKSVAHAKHGAKRVEKPAGNGLYLVIQPKPSRAMSWALRYRWHGRPCKLTLGPAIATATGDEGNGALTLAAARVLASGALDKLARGIDPAQSKPRPAAAPKTFEDVATQCFTYEAKRLRSAEDQLRDLRRLAFPMLGARPIAEVRRGDVVRLLDKIEAENGPVMADQVLSSMSKLMRWWAIRKETYACPLVPGMRRSKPKERARTRTLSDHELVLMWRAAEATPGWYGPFVQMCLLTAGRRAELAGMRRDEIVDDVWTCPKERSKTKVEIARPLSQLARAALAKVPRISNDLVFTTTGRTPASDFAREKTKLDKASGVGNFTLHDLRRSSRSLMARAGVAREVAERALGHSVPGIEATYNRHTYERELLDCYEKLATLIQNIVSPDEKIVPLRA
jgi:integrase